MTRETKTFAAALAAAAFLAAAVPALAEDKPASPPPPDWTGSLGAGISLTSGNTDTKGYNVSFALKWDPKTKNVLKVEANYLRSDTDGVATVDKTSAGIRDEYSLSEKLFLYGEVVYLRDTLKQVDYLISPTAGLGYKVVKTDAVVLSFLAGVGGSFEKDTLATGTVTTSSGAFKVGENFSWKISPTVAFTQSAAGLWRTDDTSDANYHFEAAFTTSISKLLELKLAFVDDYKNKPVDPTLKKNDSSFVAAIVAKW